MNYRKIMTQLNKALANIDFAYSVIAKKHGMTFNRLIIICLIDESDNVTQKQICDSLHLPKSTVHSILLELTKQGYISLIAGNNKKEKFVAFTKLGVNYFQPVITETQLFEDNILSTLGEKTCLFLVQTAEELGTIIKDEIAILSEGEV